MNRRHYNFKIVFADGSSIIIGASGYCFIEAQTNARNTMLDYCAGQQFTLHTYQEWDS